MGGAVVGGSNVEYTVQQGCIKKTDAVLLTNSKYTDNAVGASGKTAANGFLRVSNNSTGEVINTDEVVMADGSLTQTISGNKTFSSSMTVGSGSSNAFISCFLVKYKILLAEIKIFFELSITLTFPSAIIFS